MEVFYNELSNRPLAGDKEKARNRLLKLLKTMKALREYDINILRTHDGFYGEPLSHDYSIGSFFGDTGVRPEVRLLLRTIVASPFIEDDDSYEAEMFVTNDFSTLDESSESVSPEGLASAFVFSSPSISIDACAYWRKEFLALDVTPIDSSEKLERKAILNIYSENCVDRNAFQNWIRSLNPPIPLNSEENIYAVFPAKNFEFERRAIQDIIAWFYDDKRYLIRVKELIHDIFDHPFQGGKGQTEVLRGPGGRAAKRVVKKDRVIYTYSKDKIIIHQCKGHYDDK